MNVTAKNKYMNNKELSHLQVYLIVLIIAIFIYIGFVFVWDQTSPNYKPENFIDSEVKTPDNSRDWFIRRKNGVN
jgi:polyferredoxin